MAPVLQIDVTAKNNATKTEMNENGKPCDIKEGTVKIAEPLNDQGQDQGRLSGEVLVNQTEHQDHMAILEVCTFYLLFTL